MRRRAGPLFVALRWQGRMQLGRKSVNSTVQIYPELFYPGHQLIAFERIGRMCSIRAHLIAQRCGMVSKGQ